MLLQHGACADSCDRHGDRPIDYAIKLGFAESIHLLLKTGCSLTSNTSYYQHDPLTEASLWHEEGRRHAMWSVPQEVREAALDTVISSLRDKRVDLGSRLISSSIAPTTKLSLTRDDRILDEHALDAEQALDGCDPSMACTSTLLPNLRTVYHMNFLTAQIAEKLWQAGFRDIDTPALDGRTPLMLYRPSASWKCDDSLGEIELDAWLVMKGADLHRRQKEVSKRIFAENPKKMQIHESFKAWHYLAANIGSIAESSYMFQTSTPEMQQLQNHLHQLSHPARQFTEALFSDPSYDHCLCACSLQGCQAYIMMLKGVVETHGKDTPDIREYCLLAIELLVTLVKPENPCWHWLYAGIIRFHTFQELGIRHTCCQFNFKSPITEFDAEERTGIHSEDNEDLQLLESLLQEFGDERGNQDILDFLQGYWAKRMDEVLQTRTRNIDKDKIREIGVVLYQDEFVEEHDGECEELEQVDVDDD